MARSVMSSSSKQDLALVGLHQAHDHVEAGGLAGTIGSQQAHDLALVHLHAHAVHHGAALVAFEDVVSSST